MSRSFMSLRSSTSHGHLEADVLAARKDYETSRGHFERLLSKVSTRLSGIDAQLKQIESSVAAVKADTVVTARSLAKHQSHVVGAVSPREEKANAGLTARGLANHQSHVVGAVSPQVCNGNANGYHYKLEPLRTSAVAGQRRVSGDALVSAVDDGSSQRVPSGLPAEEPSATTTRAAVVSDVTASVVSTVLAIVKDAVLRGSSPKLDDRFGSPNDRRNSVFASESLAESKALAGGRVVTLDTGSEMLGPLECILVEPVGKQLARNNYVTLGLVICLHGMPPAESIMEEWAQVVKTTQWVDKGMTVVFPNLQMSSALQLEDLEAVVHAALALGSFPKCLLVGKAWGGQRAIELAAAHSLVDKVEGVLLVAPSSPPPVACEGLNVPVHIVWARDDDMEPFENADDWLEALDARSAPTTITEVSLGGHSFDRLLVHSHVADAVRKFVYSTFLLADVEQSFAEADEDEDGDAIAPTLSLRAARLIDELPSVLGAVAKFEDDDVESFVDSDDDTSQVSAEKKERKRRLNRSASQGIAEWMQSGMPSAAE